MIPSFHWISNIINVFYIVSLTETTNPMPVMNNASTVRESEIILQIKKFFKTKDKVNINLGRLPGAEYRLKT